MLPTTEQLQYILGGGMRVPRGTASKCLTYVVDCTGHADMLYVCISDGNTQVSNRLVSIDVHRH
jgi:hypothetical protein